MAKSLLYSTDGKVLQRNVWKCVIDKLLKMSYSLVGRNNPSQKCGKDIYKCVLVQCAEMRPGPVCGNVSIWQCGKDAFTGVTKKHCGLGAYKMCHSQVCGNVSSWLCGKDIFYMARCGGS